eukprot:SAG11_NODE_1178_length_5598_cov_4.168394_8_plen_97_part_00
MPEWMQRRKDNRFTIKSIKAIKEEHPDPTAGIRDAVENDAGGAEELSEGNFVITELWARRYDVIYDERVGAHVEGVGSPLEPREQSSRRLMPRMNT